MTQPWFERQLLPPWHGISIADVVDKAGWIPSAGGTGTVPLHPRPHPGRNSPGC